MPHPFQEPEIMAVHEVQTLRQEVADSRKKLQDYADTIVSLHCELRTLRDGICKSCKRKFVPASIVSSQADDSESSANQIPSAQSPASRTYSIFSWRRLLKAPASDLIPSSSGPPISEIPSSSTCKGSQTLLSTMSQSLAVLPAPTYVPPLFTIMDTETPASTSKPLTTTTSSKAVALESVPSSSRWSAQREATATAALDVTFVCDFNHKEAVWSVQFSPDGKYLAVIAAGEIGGKIFIYNVETGDKNCELAEYASQYSSIKTPAYNCMSLSPNGRYLVVGDTAGRVTVWDIRNKRIRNIFRGHKSLVRSVEFSPNGRLVVSSSWALDGKVCIWNIRDGSTKVFTDGSDIVVWCVRFSPNGRFVVAGNSDMIMRIWDIRTGQVVSRMKHSVMSMAFMPDGKGLVSGGHDGVLECWDVNSLWAVQSGGSRTVYTVAVSPDSQWIASSLELNTVVIWDVHNAVRQCMLIGHKGDVTSVDFSPVGSYIALGSHDRRVTLWRYTTET